MKNLIFTTLLFLGITTQAQTCLDYTIRFYEKVRKDVTTKVCLDATDSTMTFNDKIYQITNAETTNEYWLYKGENKGIVTYIMILKDGFIITTRNVNTNKLTAYAL